MVSFLHQVNCEVQVQAYLVQGIVWVLHHLRGDVQHRLWAQRVLLCSSIRVLTACIKGHVSGC